MWHNNTSYKHVFTDVSRRRDVSIQNRYRLFVSDYDLKQSVKTVFKRPAVFGFLEHTQDFCGYSQWHNQRKEQKVLYPPLAKSFRRFNPKIQAFKHILDLTSSLRGAEGGTQFSPLNDF